MTLQRWSAQTAAAVPAAEMDGALGPRRHWEAQSTFLRRPVLRFNLGLRCVVLFCCFCIFSSATKPRSWAALCKMPHRHGLNGQFLKIIFSQRFPGLTKLL